MGENLFSNYLIPFTLAVTTLGMGLSLEKRDFRNIFFRPKAISIAIASKLVLMPAIAFALCFLFDINPEFKVGLILIAACPGGATTNLITFLLRGNLALSISMTALSSLLILVTLPITVNFGLKFYIGETAEIHLPLLNTILNIFLLTILPTIVGIYIRTKKLEFAKSFEKPLRIILPLLLLVVFAGVLIVEGNQENSSLASSLFIFPIGLLLNLLGMLSGYFIARSIRLSKRNRFTVAIEVGLQNTALAIFIASTILGNNAIALVAVVYSSFTFFSTALFGYLAKKIG